MCPPLLPSPPLPFSSSTHPVPLSVLVEQDDDQLGMQLVSVLTERQITPLERHIHQVPAEGDIEDGESDKWRKNQRIAS